MLQSPKWHLSDFFGLQGCLLTSFTQKGTLNPLHTKSWDSSLTNGPHANMRKIRITTQPAAPSVIHSATDLSHLFTIRAPRGRGVSKSVEAGRPRPASSNTVRTFGVPSCTLDCTWLLGCNQNRQEAISYLRSRCLSTSAQFPPKSCP